MVMPGMMTQLNLLASRAGDFSGVSGNISGKGFAGMRFAVHAVTPDEYERWIGSVRATSQPLSESAYEALALPSENVPVITYSPIDENLYTAINMKYMPHMKPDSGMGAQQGGQMLMGPMPAASGGASTSSMGDTSMGDMPMNDMPIGNPSPQ